MSNLLVCNKNDNVNIRLHKNLFCRVCILNVVCMFVCLMLQGEMQPLFLRHEGYLGAIGAFLKGAEQDGSGPLITELLVSFNNCI